MVGCKRGEQSSGAVLPVVACRGGPWGVARAKAGDVW